MIPFRKTGRLPLRYKLSLAAFLLIGAACALLYLYVPGKLHRQSIDALRDKAETIARITAYSAAPAVVFRDSAGLREVMEASGEDADLVGMQIRDVAGNVLGVFGHAGTATVVEFTAPIEQLGERIGSVVLTLSTQRVDEAVAASRVRFTISTLVLFLTAVAGAFAFSVRVTGPLSQVANAAARIAAGGPLSRVDVMSHDEVGRLADTFNLMVSRLEAAHEELRNTNASLEQRVQERTVELETEVRERRRAEVQLRASEQRFRAIFESAGIGIAVIDAHGFVLAANHALQDTLAAYPLVTHRFVELLDPPSAARFEDDRRAVLSGSAQCTQTELVVAQGGNRASLPMVCTLSAVRDPTTPYLIALLKDVTEQRVLEERYRESQKLGAIGRLAGGVAHDFNNLLTTINGITDLLLVEGVQDELRKDLEEIRHAGTRAAQLTKQLLAFSRRQVLQPQIVQLNDVITDTTRMLRRLVGEHITIRLDLDRAAACVLADSGQIVQVIMNLVVNARDAMPNGGLVEIATGMVAVDDALGLLYDLSSRGPHVQITVRDTGRGMDAETLAHAFEPFFTTKPVGQGTGLGLATVYGIVRQSSGSITVSSTPGSGTAFRILLPAVSGQIPSAQRSVAIDPAHAHDATILVVEDESTVRHLITRVLRKRGFHILEAENGLRGLEVARAHGKHVDVLLTDVIMPSMGGVELAGKLRAENPDLRVVFMSGYTPDDVRDGASFGEKDVFLEKPMTPATLVRTLDEVLEARAAELTASSAP